MATATTATVTTLAQCTTQEQALALLPTGEATVEQVTAWLAAHAPKAAARSLSCKVSVKGALSVYGLQRMPITLYSGQWARLIEFIPQIQDFLVAHKGEFSVK